MNGSNHTFKTAYHSSMHYLELIYCGRLYLEKSNIAKIYDVLDSNYAIFRETHCKDVRGSSNVLVVGFRLKLVRSNRLLNWIFQRICILTTPFWSGMEGFEVKLWMVDPITKDYLGIYDWRGKQQAINYVNYLLPILRFFSVGGSVWFKHIEDQDLDEYLHNHEVHKHPTLHRKAFII
jgi:hypothetical protein